MVDIPNLFRPKESKKGSNEAIVHQAQELRELAESGAFAKSPIKSAKLVNSPGTMNYVQVNRFEGNISNIYVGVSPEKGSTHLGDIKVTYSLKGNLESLGLTGQYGKVDELPRDKIHQEGFLDPAHARCDSYLIKFDDKGRPSRVDLMVKVPSVFDNDNRYKTEWIEMSVKESAELIENAGVVLGQTLNDIRGEE